MTTVRKALPFLLVAATVSTSLAFARLDSRTFDFDDPKKVNSVTWLVDSPLEPIAGRATAVQGTVRFDPDKPEATTGKIVVPVSSMVAPVEGMTGHLQSARWLNAEEYPTIEFAISKVVLLGIKAKLLHEANVIDPDNSTSYELSVTGEFSLHGVSKTMTVPVTVTYTPDGLTQKMGRRLKGDLAKVRAEFELSRREFGIDGGLPLAIVGDRIEIRAALIAFCQTG